MSIKTFKIYKSGVSIWRNEPTYIGIDLDNGQQIRITNDQIPQLIEILEAVKIIEQN